MMMPWHVVLLPLNWTANGRVFSYTNPVLDLAPERHCIFHHGLVVNGIQSGLIVRWGGSVPPPVCVMVFCHSLPLPAAQEIRPHPLTKDAEVYSHYTVLYLESGWRADTLLLFGVHQLLPGPSFNNDECLESWGSRWRGLYEMVGKYISFSTISTCGIIWIGAWIFQLHAYVYHATISQEFSMCYISALKLLLYLVMLLLVAFLSLLYSYVVSQTKCMLHSSK